MAENQQPRGRAHSCCGNGGPGKSWKCPNPTFPRFPPPLEIPHKTRDSHIPTAPATADRFHTQQRKAAKIEEFYRFSLRTIFTSASGAAVSGIHTTGGYVPVHTDRVQGKMAC